MIRLTLHLDWLRFSVLFNVVEYVYVLLYMMLYCIKLPSCLYIGGKYIRRYSVHKVPAKNIDLSTEIGKLLHE